MRAERFVVMDHGSDDRSMIVDAKINDQGQLEIERLFSLDMPSLEALSHILRHRGLWPKGFEWWFEDCSTCAMGLARRLWDLKPEFTEELRTYDMARIFEMAATPAVDIFGGNRIVKTYGVKSNRLITPEMVADQIDKYLASRS